MAIEGSLDGLFVGADFEVVYTDSDEPPADMTGWTVVLDIRKKDTSNDPPMLRKVGVLSGVYANTQASNQQKFTFTLSAEGDLPSTIFKGDDPQVRYSFKRTDLGSEQPLRFGDCTVTRVTQRESN